MTLKEFTKLAVTLNPFRSRAIEAALSRLAKAQSVLKHIPEPARSAAETGLKERTHRQLSNILSRLMGRYR